MLVTEIANQPLGRIPAMRIMLSCLIVCVTLLGVPVSALSAEEIRTGYLIIEGKLIAPPYKVEVDGSTVTANGIQTYPAILSSKEMKRKLAEKDAKDLLDTLHEELFQEKQRDGEARAIENLKVKLKKSGKIKNPAVESTPAGWKVDVEDEFGRKTFVYMGPYNVPSKKRQLAAAQERIVKQYREWRQKDGKEMALNRIDAELKRESLIAEYKLDREHEAFSVRWQGHPNSGGVGLWPEGFGGKSLPTQAEHEKKRVKFQSEEIARPLRDGRCVIVFGRAIYSSYDGKPACDAVIQIVRDRPTKDQAMTPLTKYFAGRERWIWEALERYWADK